MGKEKEIAAKHRTLRGPLRWLFIIFSSVAIASAVFYNFYWSFFGWTFDAMGYLFFPPGPISSPGVFDIPGKKDRLAGKDPLV